MERILFTKYSNERAPRFSIRTDIIETDGVRWVRKQACDSKGKAHIANIHDSFVKLKSLFQGTRIEVNECAKLQMEIV